MKVVIVDLEATCQRERNPDFISEIIEIGAVKIENDTVVEEMSLFVKPTINPILTDFCTELTSITQEDVDNGLSRKIALSKFSDFCQDADFILSWGNYDKNQLIKELKRFGMKYDWLDNHRNLKHQFAILHGMQKPCGMEKALSLSGLKLDGTHHRGIDDAKNIGKIFLKFKNEWSFMY